MSKGGSGGGGKEMMPSHIPQSLRKNSISARRMIVPTFFIWARQQGQVVGSPPQIRWMRDFQSGFSACFFLRTGSGRMNKVLSEDCESGLWAGLLLAMAAAFTTACHGWWVSSLFSGMNRDGSFCEQCGNWRRFRAFASSPTALCRTISTFCWKCQIRRKCRS